MINAKTFRYSVNQGVAEIVLDRADRLNALTFAIYEELRDTFAALDHEEEVRSIMITGEGRAFCSGGDVEDIIGELFSRDMKGMLAFTRVTGALIENIRKVRRPVVAAVNGTAVGAGAVIALACDIRIASEKAKFGFIFPQVAGLGSSPMAQKYAIRSLAEATAYLDHPVLGARLRECTELVLDVQERDISDIFGYPDDLKFHSSMTLFALADGAPPMFDAALGKYFNAAPDVKTLEILGRRPQ